ncbi:ClpP/crotonase-like domain-containing protein [Lineolata rhizophorae]|uniref:ClpP/crotonase-like domain-containing protein n=1 Tax=Lineolata rhizophorae TaxID=578093 RepID=A0A6A6P3W9_9PEZI|nr:ClpP/crotonase-like domain-containing protein [Lineolata rhizophorae]
METRLGTSAIRLCLTSQLPGTQEFSFVNSIYSKVPFCLKFDIMAGETFKYQFFNVSFPEEHVAHVEINRQDKLNAFIEEMWLSMGKIFNRLSHDPNVRVIVLTGAGEKAYTAGLDVQAASEGMLSDSGDDPARKANNNRRYILEFQDCVSAIEKCEKPVITVLHGYAFGLAIDMSLCCDIRLCAATTQFCVKEVDIGVAADIGTLSRLPKAVASASWVKDVSLTARVFDAAEALRVGFVSSVHHDKQAAVKAALTLATKIASKSPVAVLGTKELINYSRDHSVADGLNYTAAWNSAMIQTNDVKGAFLSGLQKRKPTFEKL